MEGYHGVCLALCARSTKEEFEYEDQDVELKSGGEEDEDQMVIEPPEVRKAPYTIMNAGKASSTHYLHGHCLILTVYLD